MPVQETLHFEGALRCEIIATPIGNLRITTADNCLIEIVAASADEKVTGQKTSLIVQQLNEYFAGTRTVFNFEYKLPDHPFARSVMRALSQVPYGQTVSYGQLAVLAGYTPGASRAVGTVMRTNRIPLVIPCHRVIRSGGDLGQYSLYGAPAKKWLLDLEGGMRT